MPENEEVINVYNHCANQYIMGFNGPVAINIDTVIKVMELFHVEEKQKCLSLIMTVSQIVMEKLERKAKLKEKK